MLIIAVIVSVTIGISRAKLNNIVSYTYYSAFSSIRQVTSSILADYDPSDPEYQAVIHKTDYRVALRNFFSERNFFKPILSNYSLDSLISNKVRAGNSTLPFSSCGVGKRYFQGKLEEVQLYWKDDLNKCESASVQKDRKCPGTFKGLATYDIGDDSMRCYNSCEDMSILDDLNVRDQCGVLTEAFDIKCQDKFKFSNTHADFYDETVRLDGGKLGYQLTNVSSKLSSAGVCTYQLTCTDDNEEPFVEPIGNVGYIKCYVKCWDGSLVNFSPKCPSKVTCWDGSFAHNQSECPACTNKPAKIPCGQTWDETTCKLKGTAKICPSGYTLDENNCTCNCTRTCSSGYTLNTSTCQCEKLTSGGSSCDKTCSSGYTLDEDNCICNCTRTCSSGYTLNKSSCSCVKDSCTNKPSKIPCGQSWDESTCSLKGSVKTCGTGYTLNESTCTCSCTKSCPIGYVLNSISCTCVEKPKYTCWDGSKVESYSDCPSYVTCWDGSKAYNSSECPPYVRCWDNSIAGSYSQCPPCNNEPASLPCGQSWNSATCSVEGTPTVCGAGQHLNSSTCQCVNDCPEYAGCGKQCDNESGIISDIPGFSRECGDPIYEWSDTHCRCVIAPRTLPKKGENFCKLFERLSNIVPLGSVCAGSEISANTTDFSSLTPDLTLRNGIRLYNLHYDPVLIPQLRISGIDDEAALSDNNQKGYIIYADIDGVRGNSVLWDDVYPFYVTLSGRVIPAYDSSVNAEGSGGDSTHHLQVSIINETFSASGKRILKWLAKSISFKQGACESGFIDINTDYCSGSSFNSVCSSANSFCFLKYISPLKFF